MAFDVSDKRVLVAGGSRGIGLAIAKHFAAAGASVGLCARGAAALEAARADIALHGHPVHAMACDLSNEAAIAAWVPAAAEALGASTCWSTTPRASARATTKTAGPPASRWM